MMSLTPFDPALPQGGVIALYGDRYAPRGTALNQMSQGMLRKPFLLRHVKQKLRNMQRLGWQKGTVEAGGVLTELHPYFVQRKH